MHILQLCKKFPYPEHDGESIAIMQFCRAYKELGHEVTLLALNTKKHYFPIEELPEEIKQIATFHAIDIDTSITYSAALANLISGKPFHISRFISPAFEMKLILLLQDHIYDVVQLEGLSLFPYVEAIRKHSKALISYRAHNVEFEIWERVAAQEKSLFKSHYIKLQAARLRKYELAQLNSADLVIPITTRDAEQLKGLGCSIPMMVAPASVSVMGPDQAIFVPNELFFLGGLDWLPNQEGMRWFMERCWPLLSANQPKCDLHIAGRNQPEWMNKWKSSQVHIHGSVPDAAVFMAAHGIMLVPLFSGSGMRIKVIEALAQGIPLVATTLAVEGINVAHEKHLLIADSPEDFVSAIHRLAKDKALRLKLREEGMKLVKSEYYYLSVAQKVLNMYQHYLP